VFNFSGISTLTEPQYSDYGSECAFLTCTFSDFSLVRLAVFCYNPEEIAGAKD
jgi:hypothetical protein